MEAVGFIGLGNMGSKMVERLLKAGYTVIGYNRTKEKAYRSSSLECNGQTLQEMSLKHAILR